MDQEQRSAPRVDVEPDFSVLSTFDGQRFLAIVYDISRAGVLVDVSQNDGRHISVSMGERVEFQDLPEYLQPALRGIMGRVVRQDGLCWGIEFLTPLDLVQPEIDRLQEHLEIPLGPDWKKF